MIDSWQVFKMGDLLTQNFHGVKVLADKSYKLLGVRLEGRGAFLREEKSGGTISANILSPVHAGDFIYSRLFAWRGAFGVVPETLDGCFVSGEFPTFTINTEKLLPKFLQLFFARSVVWEEVESYCTGTTKASRNRFKEQFFLGFEIPIPPLEEQRRIVERVEALSSRIEKAQSLRKEASQEIDLLFFKASKQVFEDVSNNLTKIGEAFRVSTGGTPSRSNPSYWNGDVKWVSSGEVAFSQIKDTREKITELGVSESNAKIYPPNTVLIAMIGQGKTRGQCAILDCYASTNQNVAGIHVYETEHLPKYVYWWLRSRYLESRLSETGTAQPALSGERVKQMPIPLPPLDKQRRIVAYLDSVQARLASLRELQSATGEELSALLPSVLDRAFKGEL